jgi:hypothetical protein
VVDQHRTCLDHDATVPAATSLSALRFLIKTAACRIVRIEQGVHVTRSGTHA